MKFSVLILFGCLSFTTVFAQGYKIKVRIKGVESGYFKLAYYFEDKQFIVDSVPCNKKGEAVFQKDYKLPGGLYLVAFSQKSYFDIIISDDQEFDIETDTGDVVKKMKITDCLENELFYDYQRYVFKNQPKIQILNEELSKVHDQQSDTAVRIQKEVDSLITNINIYWKKLLTDSKGTFFESLMKATTEEGGKFFENINFADDRLLRTPFIWRAIRITLARNLNENQSMQILWRELDNIIKKSVPNNDVHKYMVLYVLNFLATFERAGINDVFVKIADDYILEKDPEPIWLDTAAVKQVKKRADMFRQSMEGSIAPDIEMERDNGEMIKLSQLQNKATLILFWVVGCGHCEKAIKDLGDFYENNTDLDIDIVAVYNKDNKEEWTKFLKDNGIPNWINVWDPKDISGYRLKYYVVSSPIMYMLDNEKRIISRRIGDGPIKDLLDQMEKHKGPLKR